MASTGVLNGTKLRLYTDTAGGSTYAVMGTSLDATLNLAHSPRETTNQDSGGFATFLEGKRSVTIDFNNLHAEDSTVNFEDYFDSWSSSSIRAAVGWKISTAVSGDKQWTGTGYITSLVLNSGGPEANSTFSGSIQGTGTPTKSTVTP